VGALWRSVVASWLAHNGYAVLDAPTRADGVADPLPAPRRDAVALPAAQVLIWGDSLHQLTLCPALRLGNAREERVGVYGAVWQHLRERFHGLGLSHGLLVSLSWCGGGGDPSPWSLARLPALPRCLP
jgi:hypothetical protein